MSMLQSSLKNKKHRAKANNNHCKVKKYDLIPPIIQKNNELSNTDC